MSRSRNIKPSLFKNEILGTEDPLLTLLFCSLWCLADKSGRLEDRPLRIKAETFPYREGIDINRYLTDLERLGFISRYSVGKLAIIQVTNFSKHQHPHHTEKESELPEFSDTCHLTVKPPLQDGELPVTLRLIPDSLNTDSLNLIPEKNLTPSDDGPLPPKPADRIPYDAIFDLFVELCPSLPSPRIRDDKRKSMIRSVWKMDNMHQSTDFFRWLFDKVEKSDFLTGRKTDYRAGFDFVCSPRNLKKIVEGNYDNR